MVDKETLTKARAKNKLLAEIKIHRSLQHRYIVGFETFFEDRTNVYIILELCSSQTLMELVKRRKHLSEPETAYFMLQLIDAVRYLHANNIIHRDLKLGNLFLTENMEIRVGDLGLATQLAFKDERKRTVCGTPNYIAPEILDGKDGHSFEVDTWALGVILYTLIIGKPPFETADVKSTYKKIRENDYAFPAEPKISAEAKDLITRILRTVPSTRPSLDAIAQHPFFTGPRAFFPTSLPQTALQQLPLFAPEELVSGARIVQDMFGRPTGGLISRSSRSTAAPANISAAEASATASAPTANSFPGPLPPIQIPRSSSSGSENNTPQSSDPASGYRPSSSHQLRTAVDKENDFSSAAFRGKQVSVSGSAGNRSTGSERSLGGTDSVATTNPADIAAMINLDSGAPGGPSSDSLVSSSGRETPASNDGGVLTGILSSRSLVSGMGGGASIPSSFEATTTARPRSSTAGASALNPSPTSNSSNTPMQTIDPKNFVMVDGRGGAIGMAKQTTIQQQQQQSLQQSKVPRKALSSLSVASLPSSSSSSSSSAVPDAAASKKAATPITLSSASNGFSNAGGTVGLGSSSSISVSSFASTAVPSSKSSFMSAPLLPASSLSSFQQQQQPQQRIAGGSSATASSASTASYRPFTAYADPQLGVTSSISQHTHQSTSSAASAAADHDIVMSSPRGKTPSAATTGAGAPSSASSLTSAFKPLTLNGGGATASTAAMSMSPSGSSSSHPAANDTFRSIYEALSSSPSSSVGAFEASSPPEPAGVWVTIWLDYTSKYGLGYLLSNGCVGVYFNDATKIIVTTDGQQFEYIERSGSSLHGGVSGATYVMGADGFQRAVGSVSSYPEALKKKVTLVKHFRGYLLEQYERRRQLAQGRLTAVEVAEAAQGLFAGAVADGGLSAQAAVTPVPVSELEQQCMAIGLNACTLGRQGIVAGGLSFCKKWVRTRRAILLRLSNRTVQVSFYDGAHILLSADGRVATMIDAQGARSVYSTHALLAQGGVKNSAEDEVLRRINYAKGVIQQLAFPQSAAAK